LCRQAGYRQRYAKDRISTQPAFVFCAIKGNQTVVDFFLAAYIVALQGIVNFGIDALDRILNTFTAKTCLVIIAMLDGFTGAGAGTGRNGGTGHTAPYRSHFNLYGRVTAGIQNFSCDDTFNFKAHKFDLLLRGWNMFNQNINRKVIDELKEKEEKPRTGGFHAPA
jgi:hypothetical protein